MAPGSPIMPIPTSSRFCDCCNTTFHSVKALLAHQRDMETQRTQNINPAKTKAKKRKINHANHHRTENQRKTTGRKNLNNVITGLSNSEVAEIPCNNSWTFIGNIIVKCTFCPKTFNRPDAYLLHYRDKHDRVDMEPNSSNRYHHADENINNKECNDVDAVVNHSHKKRRCTPKVLHNDETDTSSDSDTSDDETAEIPIAVVEKDKRNTIVEKADVIDSVETPNENVNGVPKRKRKRDSSKSKQTDDHSSSSSDSDDSILEAQIENLLNTYVSKLTDLAKEFKDEIIKMKKKQRKRTYKCDTCSLHFGKKGEWRRHMKKCSHSDIKKPQRSHCRRNSHKKILQENKMHILETDTGTEDNNTGSDTFDDEDQTTAPNSISENRRKRVKEPSQVNENQETNGPETENEHNEDTQVQPETVQIKAKKGENILYKCDYCEEHFLHIYYAVRHRTVRNTHHKTKKKYVCDICMIIFNSPSALKTHKSEHKDLCLTRDDFKIIPLTLGLRMLRQTVNPEAKIRRNKLKSPVSNTGNVSENELCKVVLSKSTHNSWVVSRKNGRKSTDENDNESNLNTNDTVRQNPHADEGTDSNDQITIENGMQSPDNTSYLSTVTENINNTDTTINLENPQNQILPNVHDHLNTANATNSMGKITNNKYNTYISTTNTGYKNSQSFKEFEPENDNFIPETRTDYNPNNPLGDIKITERYSTRLKFEEPDGQNSFETPTSSRIHSNFDVNIAVDRTPRQHNNVHYDDDDSRSTLILSEVPIDLRNHRHDGVIESNHTENIGTPTATGINNEDDEHNQSSEEADDLIRIDLTFKETKFKQENVIEKRRSSTKNFSIDNTQEIIEAALGRDSYGLGAGSAIAAAASQAIAAAASQAIAAASSQAIAATQQMASGCRSISYDAVASGELSHHTLHQAQHTTHLDQGLLSGHSYSSGMHGHYANSHAHSSSSASNKPHNKQNLNFNMVNNMAMEETVEEKYDPNGPRYCICNQISDGYMIGCDNQECLYEWFHWQCVGITAAPKGNWYCPQCRTNMCRNR